MHTLSPTSPLSTGQVPPVRPNGLGALEPRRTASTSCRPAAEGPTPWRQGPSAFRLSLPRRPWPIESRGKLAAWMAVGFWSHLPKDLLIPETFNFWMVDSHPAFLTPKGLQVSCQGEDVHGTDLSLKLHRLFNQKPTSFGVYYVRTLSMYCFGLTGIS